MSVLDEQFRLPELVIGARAKYVLAYCLGQPGAIPFVPQLHRHPTHKWSVAMGEAPVANVDWIAALANDSRLQHVVSAELPEDTLPVEVSRPLLVVRFYAADEP